MTQASQKKVLFADEAQAIWVRRLILFLAMMMSGGHVFLPREPMLVMFLFASLLVVSPISLLRGELSRIWALLLVILMVSMIGAGSFPVVDTAIRFANFLAALILLVIYLDKPASQIMRDVTPILAFFAVQAILTPIFALTLPGLFGQIVYETSTYQSFAGLFIYHEGAAGFLGLERPDGFFFEPGVLQIYLNLLLYIALFQRRSLILAGLALGGVGATQSTTGLIISVMLCGFATLRWVRKSQASIGVLAVVIAPFAVGPIVYLTYLNLIDKLFGATQGSATARSFDTEIGLLIVKDHPLFGIGFSQDRFRDEFRTFGRTVDNLLGDSALDRTMSSGVIHVMVVLGIPIFLFFVYAICRQRLFNRSLLVSALMILSMMTEALLLTPFFLAIVFSGLMVSQRVTVPRAQIHRAGVPHESPA